MKAIVYYGNKPCEEAAAAAAACGRGRVLDVLCIQFMRQEVRFLENWARKQQREVQESGENQQEAGQGQSSPGVAARRSEKRSENEPPKLAEASAKLTSCIWQQAPQMNDETEETKWNKPTIIIAICALSAAAMLICSSSVDNPKAYAKIFSIISWKFHTRLRELKPLV